MVASKQVNLEKVTDRSCFGRFPKKKRAAEANAAGEGLCVTCSEGKDTEVKKIALKWLLTTYFTEKRVQEKCGKDGGHACEV